MDATLGTFHTIGGRPALRFERLLRHPPEKVWRAITDPAELAHWFPATVETEPRAGAPMRFTFQGQDLPVLDGEIIEFDRPKLYVYRWGDDLLRWELVPEGGGCRLFFTQTYGDDHAWGGPLAAARHAAGWDGCLDALVARLDGRTVEFGMDRWFERNERYVERFGLAEGKVLHRPDGYLVRFERDLIQPVEQVWAALAGPAGSSPDNSSPDGHGAGPVVGAAPPPAVANRYVPAGPVTAVEPPRSLEYTWEHDGAPAGRVRWDLVAQNFGSRLVVTQTVPAPLADLRATVLAAWQIHLELFIAAMHGSRRPWPAERTEALRKAYAARL